MPARGQTTDAPSSARQNTEPNATTDASAPPSAAVEIASRRSRTLAVVATLALIGLGLAWELSVAPTGARSLALKVVPLALVLPGLSRMRLSSYRATSLLVWLYALEGAARAASDVGIAATLAALELVLALLLFAACVMHVRVRVGPRASRARS